MSLFINIKSTLKKDSLVGIQFPDQRPFSKVRDMGKEDVLSTKFLIIAKAEVPSDSPNTSALIKILSCSGLT